MKTLLTLTAAVTLAAALPAAAGTPSQLSELRGYNTCLSTHANEYRGLTTARTYLMADNGASRTYYINATAWQDGERVPVGITCDTTRDGRELLSTAVTATRFASAEEVGGVQVAGQ